VTVVSGSRLAHMSAMATCICTGEHLRELVDMAAVRWYVSGSYTAQMRFPGSLWRMAARVSRGSAGRMVAIIVVHDDAPPPAFSLQATADALESWRAPRRWRPARRREPVPRRPRPARWRVVAARQAQPGGQRRGEGRPSISSVVPSGSVRVTCPVAIPPLPWATRGRGARAEAVAGPAREACRPVDLCRAVDADAHESPGPAVESQPLDTATTPLSPRWRQGRARPSKRRPSPARRRSCRRRRRRPRTVG